MQEAALFAGAALFCGILAVSHQLFIGRMDAREWLAILRPLQGIVGLVMLVPGIWQIVLVLSVAEDRALRRPYVWTFVGAGAVLILCGLAMVANWLTKLRQKPGPGQSIMPRRDALSLVQLILGIVTFLAGLGCVFAMIRWR